MQQITTIIFDLGGVFLNIDFSRTATAFAQHGFTGFNQLYTQHHAVEIFELLETGKLSPAEFCAQFREASGTELPDATIIAAWNALLVDFPQERIHWLNDIRNRYQVFLFSNTNRIHYEEFTGMFSRQTGGDDFNRYFVKAYYSHEMGLRKPYLESFQYIISEQQLDPAATLFIDDTLANITTARQAGLQTIHLAPPATVLDLSL